MGRYGDKVLLYIAGGVGVVACVQVISGYTTRGDPWVTDVPYSTMLLVAFLVNLVRTYHALFMLERDPTFGLLRNQFHAGIRALLFFLKLSVLVWFAYMAYALYDLSARQILWSFFVAWILILLWEGTAYFIAKWVYVHAEEIERQDANDFFKALDIWMRLDVVWVVVIVVSLLLSAEKAAFGSLISFVAADYAINLKYYFGPTTASEEKG